MRLGYLRRSFYASRLAAYARSAVAPGPDLPFRVVSFSGERDAAEQVACWISLLRHLGTPQELLLVSDGSHQPGTKEILQSVHPSVRIRSYQEFLHPELPDCVHQYAARHPLGKKLAMYCASAELAPFLYLDSDILFFPGASHFRQLVDGGARLLYLQDCAPSFDTPLLHNEEERLHPVNSGFLYTREALPLDKGLSRFQVPEQNLSWFSEQTIVHLAVHDAGGQPLPADRYIMRAEDQWSAFDAYASQPIAMRHYISSIRYKMWHQVPLT
jgi:hypothetical protein